MASIIFSYDGRETTIQCQAQDKMNDICQKFASKINVDINQIYFISGGNKLNLELSFSQLVNSIDKDSNIIKILVCDKTKNISKENLKKSKEIICPECNKNSLIQIKDYKIRLYGCQNGHETKNILLDEYYNTQCIDESRIICKSCNNNDKSKTFNNQFFSCLDCKINLCPLCKLKDNKDHKIIDYDNNIYICNIHNDFFVSFCNECKNNLCMNCETQHNKSHKITSYKNILPNKDEIMKVLYKYKQKIDQLNNDLSTIIITITNIINKVKENMKILYKINFDLFNSYEMQKRDYYKLQNLNEIKKNININNIDEIINSNNIEIKFKNILNIYNQMINREQITKKNEEIKENSLSNNVNIEELTNEINISNNDNKEDLTNENIIRENNKEKEDIYYDNNEINDGIKIIYKVNKYDKKIKIFGEKFVENNRYHCNIKYENKLINLIEYLVISHDNKLKDKLEIRLIGINNIINASYMFDNCISLLSIPNISKWNTNRVKDMSNMFYSCNSISSFPDISNWDTSNVTSMHSMFAHCSSISSLPDISKWNTSKVVNMCNTFACCTSLISLPDISKWDISNVTDISFIFRNCKSLQSFPNISNWNTHKITMFCQVFYNCSAISSLPDISKWNTDNAKDMEELFANCSSLSSLPDISKWNTSKVTNMSKMYFDCTSLKSLPDISKWNIDKVNEKKQIFSGCTYLSSIPEIFI